MFLHILQMLNYGNIFFSFSFRNVCQICACLNVKANTLELDKPTFSCINYLTAHNWEKWKRAFLLCYFHEIYKVRIVGLKHSTYTLKLTRYVNMWNFGQLLNKKMAIASLFKFESENSFAHVNLNNYDYLSHTKFRFFQID